MSRFDKRVAVSDENEDRPTLNSFQQDLLEKNRQAAAQRTANHHARPMETKTGHSNYSSNINHHVSAKVYDLSLEEAVLDNDGRTLGERLTSQGDNEASNAALAALIARTLDSRHGEIVVHLDPNGNLLQRDTASLFDEPDPTCTSSSEHNLLPKTQVEAILRTLESITSTINSRVSILHNPYDDEGKRKLVEGTPGTETASSANDDATRERWRGKTLRLLVRRIGEGAEDINEVRLCVVGNVDAGKSSLLGVLTKGRLDDGRGRARVALFRHKHEVESGRTSSVGLEVLGFGPDGAEVLPESHASALTEKNVDNTPPSTSRRQQLSWEDIVSRAHKIVSFSDLAGHEKYLSCTLFGMTATSPDFVLLIVGANAGLIGMSKEHLSVALALSVPIAVVVTKVDSTPPNILEQTIKQLNKVLRSPGCRKQPVYVKDAGMACELARSFVPAKACPIFMVSNVTGEGLSNLKLFLNVVTPAGSAFPTDADFEFTISDCFSVPFVGTVVSGIILGGTVAVGDTVLLGPDSLGAFTPTAIKSIQRKRVNVQSAEAGQSVSFALKRIKRTGVRKGMVLLAKTEVQPVSTRRFEGSVLVLYHNSLISPHYQAMLHVGSVRQTVQIESIYQKPCIRTGDRATVVLRFIKHPEWLRPGDRFLFREGRTKALGVVTKLLPSVKEPIPGVASGPAAS